MRERKNTVCILCSLACPFQVDVEDGEPVGLEYDTSSGVTGGALCARGNMAFELLRLPARLETPLVAGRATRWPETLRRLAEEIKRLPAGSVGLVLGSDATAEEARAAGVFAAKCLGGAPGAVAFAANEDAVLAEAGAQPPVPAADLSALAEAQTVLAIGDVFTLCPVVSRRVLDAKYAKRGNALVYLGPTGAGLTERMAGFKVLAPERRAAAAVLKELAALSSSGSADVTKAGKLLSGAGLDLAGAAKAAEVLRGSAKTVVLAGSADPVAVRLGKLIAAALGENGSFLAMTEAAGAADVLDNWRPAAGLAGLADRIRKGALKGLVILGADPVSLGALGAEDLKGLALVAAGSAFASATTDAARFVLPTALWMEKSGRLAGADREAAVAPTGGAESYAWILEGLAREMGAELTGAAELAEVAPLTLEDALREAIDGQAISAPWTARESSDPVLRKALGGVYAT